MENGSQSQRASLLYPYDGSFDNAVPSDGQSSLPEAGMSDTWKMFGLQSPQCISQQQLSGLNLGFRTPHDDLCAHPPKCPTTGSHFGSNGSNYNHPDTGGSASLSHMLFHTRHYDPHTLSGSSSNQNSHQLQSLPASSGGEYVDGLNLMDFSTTSCLSQNDMHTSTSTSMSAANTQSAFQSDFSEQLSALSSPTTHASVCPGTCQGTEDDADTDCDSDCGVGVICTDSACSDDPSGCCLDENCLQEQNLASSTGPNITSEDAIAAAALTSFVEQQRQHQQSQAAAAVEDGIQSHGNNHHSVSASSGPNCLPLGLGLDMCISPQFLVNYQHLRDAHNPFNHSECTASYCPVEDPNFYEECHIRHLPKSQCGLFDNIDFDMLMDETAGRSHVHTHSGNHSHNHNHLDSVECGAKFANSEAMIEHLWNEHRKSLNLLQQFPTSFNQVAAIDSSAVSSVSLSSQDVAKTPPFSASSQYPYTGISLPEATFSTYYEYDHGQTDGQFGGFKDTAVQLQLQNPTTAVPQTEMKLGSLQKEVVQQSGATDSARDQCPQTFECVWCDAVDGPPCGRVFDSASELHGHVLSTHTHQLKRDIGGTYSCGWLGCNRRDSGEKGGFAQKSKIDRHMQVHTGTMHIRTHTKVRPLKCPYCDKEFSESSNLSKHKRIHNGEGQYECKFPGCKRLFHRKDQLRRHSAQHSKSTLPSVIVKPLSSSSVAVNKVAV
ncbi:zinc-finger protein [Sporothrix epigloea]|uniref:Zinc-finger protein n=1 Tax=Sporothrix epigloea TaxID=1892477 RepID=A0ABP0D7Q9_9PEZI